MAFAFATQSNDGMQETEVTMRIWLARQPCHVRIPVLHSAGVCVPYFVVYTDDMARFLLELSDGRYAVHCCCGEAMGLSDSINIQIDVSDLKYRQEL